MDKLTIISGCLFLAADIFAIASIANPDWINTGEAEGKSIACNDLLCLFIFFTAQEEAKKFSWSSTAMCHIELRCMHEGERLRAFTMLFYNLLGYIPNMLPFNSINYESMCEWKVVGLSAWLETQVNMQPITIVLIET